jgi:uncharacterized protein (UPF0548 family)
MTIAGVRWGRLAPADRQRLLDAARAVDVTYDHVGSTLDPDRWPTRSPYVRRRTLGRGDQVFATAVERLRSWAPQRALGAAVHPSDATLEDGATILIELRLGPAAFVVPDRIVALVDQPRRFGFAYGTLPGHAEKGEESFLIEQADDDGTVTATVTVDAGLGTWAARLAAPVVGAIQRMAVDRYLKALVVEH